MNQNTLGIIPSMGGLFLALSIAGQSLAAPFTFIRIGDEDGFGFGTAAGLKAANGGSANVPPIGNLGLNDFLPDLDESGFLQAGDGDDFDNRDAAELSDTKLNGSGFTDDGGAAISGSGTIGSRWTDLSLSTSYDDPPLNGNPGDFPDGNPNTPNSPTFEFDFFVATGDITVGTSLFFNMLFGDYDVDTADLTFTFVNGSTSNVLIPKAIIGPANDGLIESSFAVLGFNDVFQATTGGFDGFLRVEFNADTEPFLAFDFVELSLQQIEVNASTPEPGTFALAALGMALLGFVLWRRRT